MDRPVTVTAATVIGTPLLATPPAAVTTTLPVVAPAGTVAVIDVLVQLPTAVVPLNLTLPFPWLAPKFVPLMVTEAPTEAEGTDRLVMAGAATTVKATPLLATLFTVTTTLPVAAPAGTVAVIEVLLQFPIAVAVVPLNFTVLLPCVLPKFVPAITIAEPTAALFGVRLLTVGVLGQHGKADAVAGNASGRGHHHVARGRSHRYRCRNRRVGPAPYPRRRRAVELDTPVPLAGSEVRTADGHRGSDRSRGWCKTVDVRRRYHGEGHTVAGHVVHRYHHVARGRSRRYRRRDRRCCSSSLPPSPSCR